MVAHAEQKAYCSLVLSLVSEEVGNVFLLSFDKSPQHSIKLPVRRQR